MEDDAEFRQWRLEQRFYRDVHCIYGWVTFIGVILLISLCLLLLWLGVLVIGCMQEAMRHPYVY